MTFAKGPLFLKAINCSGKRKDAYFQFEILWEAIEDVGVDSRVQGVIDATTICILLGDVCCFTGYGLLVNSPFQGHYCSYAAFEYYN